MVLLLAALAGIHLASHRLGALMDPPLGGGRYITSCMKIYYANLES
jgi:hypothetical protein